jgi:hypothetical protein
MWTSSRRRATIHGQIFQSEENIIGYEEQI